MVPVLTLVDEWGQVDAGACSAYAQRASEGWLDLFLVSGSLGLGFALARETRRELVHTWLARVSASRLVACCWEAGEVEEVAALGVRPMVVLRGAEGDGAVLDALRELPGGCFVYSHPQYTPSTLTAPVVEKARADGVLPVGAKVSKVELDEVRALRAAAGPGFELFDGRCRHVRASVEAGATGVVAVPLSTLPADLPPRDDLDGLQTVIDRGQAVVDRLPDLASQAAELRRILLAAL
jgi:dihydrodipicolinate synthase/N-acetylneuraminate lyase